MKRCEQDDGPVWPGLLAVWPWVLPKDDWFVCKLSIKNVSSCDVFESSRTMSFSGHFRGFLRIAVE